MPSPEQSWLVVTKPIVDRWKLCAKLGMAFSEALATLVENMARIIDNEIDRREAQ